MIDLDKVVEFCNKVTYCQDIKDFPFAYNGLQVQNRGKISKIGAAVDVNLEVLKKVHEKNIDFLIVHHGLFWENIVPLIGASFEKVKLLMSNDIALYASHLPLDCHKEIGNNILIAKVLELPFEKTFLPYEGKNIGIIANSDESRSHLRKKVESIFPRCISMEYGSESPKRVGIVSGSSNIPISELKDNGIDAFITGELKQRYFSLAQDEKLNFYLCGHYATEIFGVKALAELVARQFEIEWEFIESECPL